MSGRRIIALASLCGAFAFTAQGAVAGEITGNGTLKPVHGNSPCAFSGQEDLQWFTDDSDQTPLANPVKIVAPAQTTPQTNKVRRAPKRSPNQPPTTWNTR